MNSILSETEAGNAQPSLLDFTARPNVTPAMMVMFDSASNAKQPELTRDGALFTPDNNSGTCF